ncbi:hypothetical protein [Streptomyces sp. H39-S7]|uniref:hypothetical protein n=1 Tax=Streptomyces sp. H39-S7 TaxID=3004357 RepID=UPI0022AE5B29|nr:hypothetical protein [Streptomyces sp. H39-S7]MCZ4121004.1 hypothetical protein [Streptomyces sp. H39-S7]
MAEREAVREPVDLCDWCGRLWHDGGVLAIVRDSSAVHATDPAKDGMRLLVACGGEHLGPLLEKYRGRPFVEEELWSWQIVRALSAAPDDMTVDELGPVTGLTAPQIHRALAWRDERAEHVDRPGQDSP